MYSVRPELRPASIWKTSSPGRIPPKRIRFTVSIVENKFSPVAMAPRYRLAILAVSRKTSGSPTSSYHPSASIGIGECSLQIETTVGIDGEVLSSIADFESHMDAFEILLERSATDLDLEVDKTKVAVRLKLTAQAI